MNEMTKRPDAAIDDDARRTYASLYVMKKMDLDAKEGGMVFPILLPSELSPLDDILHDLVISGHVEINKRKERYQLTKQGVAYLGEVIDEAEALIDEFDDQELEDTIVELRSRNLDVFRARFLWGWYSGELDDLILFQQRRGISPIEQFWAFYLTGDDLYRELARDTDPPS